MNIKVAAFTVSVKSINMGIDWNTCTPSLIAYADASKCKRAQFCPGLHLHPCFDFAGSEGSGEPWHLPRLT